MWKRNMIYEDRFQWNIRVVDRINLAQDRAY